MFWNLSVNFSEFSTLRILLKVSVCLILILSLKKIDANNVRIKKIENIYLLINNFVLSIKNTTIENIIKDFIKLDLSPEIKILNGIKIKKALKKNFDLVSKFVFKKYVVIRNPKHKISPPTTSSPSKKLTILVPSGLTLPKILWPKVFSNNTSNIVMLIIISQFLIILSKIILSLIRILKAYAKNIYFIKLKDLTKPS